MEHLSAAVQDADLLRIAEVGTHPWRRRIAERIGAVPERLLLRRTVEAAIDLGVESLCVYAFSTENWSRPADEVDSLMEIFSETIERELPDLAAEGVRTRFVGRRDRAPETLRAQMEALEGETAGNERLNLWIAFDYGGRAELAEAARRLVADGLAVEEIDESALAERLYAPEMPDGICTVTEPVPVLPALSFAVEVLTTPAAGVSVVTESVAGLGKPGATPEPKSVADQLMPTLSLCQPAAFAAGETAAVTTGAVLSVSTV